MVLSSRLVVKVATVERVTALASYLNDLSLTLYPISLPLNFAALA